MAWALRHPSRSHPIIGTQHIAVSHQAGAALQLTLDAQQWYRLWQAGAGHGVA